VCSVFEGNNGVELCSQWKSMLFQFVIADIATSSKSSGTSFPTLTSIQNGFLYDSSVNRNIM
jgi:hypothetical protein